MWLMATDAEILSKKMEVKTAKDEISQLQKFVVDTEMEIKMLEAENEKPDIDN